MFILTSILIYSKYFRMEKIISARNVRTVRNIEPKPWPQIPGYRSGFLVLDVNSQIAGLRSCVPVRGSCVPVHSVVITKSFKKFFPSVTGITKLSQNVIGTTKCEKKYLQNPTGIRERTLSMQEGRPDGFTIFLKKNSQPRRTQT